MDASSELQTSKAQQAPSETRWYYCVIDGEKRTDPKGPLVAKSLLRLLEAGILSPEKTMVCSATEWKWLAEEDLLRDKVNLVRHSWYYAEGQERKGPLNLSELRRRFEAGEIDGLSRVYWRNEWLAVAEVSGLREVLAPSEGFESLGKSRTEENFSEDESSEQLPNLIEEGAKRVEDARLSQNEQPKHTHTKKRKRKQGFDPEAAKCWVYVENIPADTGLDEIASHFAQCGIIATDPDTMRPRIKIYKDEYGQPKGDASVCYAHEASVELALQIIDGSLLRYGVLPIRVSRATFSEDRLGTFDSTKRLSTKTDAARLKIAKQLARQRRDWNQDEDAPQFDAVTKDKHNSALRIVVVFNAFDLKIPGDADACEERILERIKKAGASRVPDKITIFSSHPQAIALIKFASAADARITVDAFDRAVFWDGITDYSKDTLHHHHHPEADEQNEKEEEARLNDFGAWLDQSQADLPPELLPKKQHLLPLSSSSES